MKRLIGCALGAAMLTGLGLAPAQAGVLGPVSNDAVAVDAAITKATYYGYGGYGGYGYYGYYPRRYYRYGYYYPRRYYGYGYYPRRYGYRYW
jgi:hypothetical protein